MYKLLWKRSFLKKKIARILASQAYLFREDLLPIWASLNDKNTNQYIKQSQNSKRRINDILEVKKMVMTASAL